MIRAVLGAVGYFAGSVALVLAAVHIDACLMGGSMAPTGPIVHRDGGPHDARLEARGRAPATPIGLEGPR